MILKDEPPCLKHHHSITHHWLLQRQRPRVRRRERRLDLASDALLVLVVDGGGLLGLTRCVTVRVIVASLGETCPHVYSSTRV